MCHLAVEKALKGLYFEIRKEIPSKTHSLVYLLTEVSIRPPENHGRFIVRLSEASIPTRYPESLAVAQIDFTSSIVKELLYRSKEVIAWIKTHLSK